MKVSKLVFVLMLSVALTASGKKPPKQADPILCAIKTVFVSSNNQASNDVRINWTRLTGIRVVGNKDEADAVIDITMQMDSINPGSPLWEKHFNQLSAVFTDKSGKQIFFVNTNDYWHDAAPAIAKFFRNYGACGLGVSVGSNSKR